jgi:mannose-6-phosphate isomerase-like protein (cupin superfamily)
MKKTLFAALFAASFTLVLLAQQKGDLFWAPKPNELTKYVPPHKPLTRFADVKAKHAGQANWGELVVDDDQLHAEYISSAPGTRAPKQMHPDTREWWVVMDGQIRFDIEGQQPFTASKGWMVQVPMQTIYSFETVGDKPSVRYEVNIAGAKRLYVQEADIPKMPGMGWLHVRVGRMPGVYLHGNKPYVTYDELAKALDEKKLKGTVRIVQDDRGTANFIYGRASDLPPINPKDRGHYHPESCEFWLVMSGQIRYPIEGQGVVIANEGDTVYVPKFTFHAPRWYGDGPSCRLAMNGYPNIAHLFDATKE